MFELTLQVIIKMKRHSLVRITMFFKKTKITFSINVNLCAFQNTRELLPFFKQDRGTF